MKQPLKIVHHSLGVPKNNYRTTVGDAADLDLVMPMYNLLEYSSYYSDTTGSLWVFFRKMKQLIMMLILFMIMLLNLSSMKDEADGSNGILKNTTITVPLKYLSNFWKSI